VTSGTPAVRAHSRNGARAPLSSISKLKWAARLIPRRAALARQNGRRNFRGSTQFFAGRNLSGLQKGFDEFAFAANGQAGKSLEPFSLRHFRPGAQPIRQKPKLIGGNFPAADAVEQMIKKAGRKIVAANSRRGYSP
jgi:hypothetical protein